MKRQKKKPGRPKRKQSAPQQVAVQAQTDEPEAALSRRHALAKLKTWGIGLAVAGGGGWYLIRDVQATMREQDLSQIGNGMPAIVQVHDPNCPSCAQLQRNARDAVCELGTDNLQFLVANIHTESGRRFAAKHNVPHITLVFLDGGGERKTVLSGVHESEQLVPVFRDHIKFYGPKAASGS